MHKLTFMAYKTINRLSNYILALLVFLVFLSFIPNATSNALEVNGTNYIVSSENDLKDAISAINTEESGEYTITLNADITIDGNHLQPTNQLKLQKNSVTIYGANHTLHLIKACMWLQMILC